MKCVTGLLVLCLAATFPSSLSSLQELVLQKEGTKEYHRPGCEVIRDGKGVLAMTRAQAESRGLKAHAQCDAARLPSAGGDAAGRGSAAPVFVFVDGSAKSSGGESNQLYHRESCARLGKERRKLNVDEAAKRYWPCAKCRPPIRKRK